MNGNCPVKLTRVDEIDTSIALQNRSCKLNPIYRTSPGLFTVLLLVLVAGILVQSTHAREPGKTRSGKGADDGPERILELDGTNVHNVGELQMHLFNWGEWGVAPRNGRALFVRTIRTVAGRKWS